MKMENIVKRMIDLGITISTMESCTGGYIASNITNIEGSSSVFSYGAVTYSNYFKEKMGVSKDIIDKYSVYSIEVAREMAKVICKYANSSIGLGITGKLNRVDVNNNYGKNNYVYVSLYSDGKYEDLVIKLDDGDRLSCKEKVLDYVVRMLDLFIK